MYNIDFEKNNTMKKIAKTPCISADSIEGRAIADILEGLGLPLTNDNIMIGSFAISYGKLLGKQEVKK